MPVDLILNSQKYFNQYINHESFSVNPTDFTDNLVGCAMEKIKVEIDFKISSYFQEIETAPLTWEDTGSDLWRVKKTTGTFAVDGFAIGDFIRITPPTGGFLAGGQIASISGDWIYIDITNNPGNMPVVTPVLMQNTTKPTALIFKPNLIENDEVFNIISKVSGNDSAYYLAGISGSWQDMTPLGSYRDFVSGNVQVTSPATAPFVYEFNFRVRHTFLIAPYYIEGWQDNLIDGIAPAIYDGLASLKYIYETDFRTVLSNPNSSKISRVGYQLGSTGFFNENFNGFNNNYNIESVAYEDSVTASASDGVLVGSKTKVTVIIKKLTGAFSANDRAGFHISYAPTESEYTNKTTDIIDNFMYDSKVTFATNPSVAGIGIIKSLESSILNPTTLEIIAEVEYNTAQQLRLSEISKFIIGVGISDDALSSGNSDRVVLLADYGEYELNADISGLMGISAFGLQHYDDVYAPIETWTSLVAWNEDGINTAFTFWLDTNFDALINSLDFVLLAYNNTTEEYFELDKYTFGVSNSVTVGGIQQLIFNETRGYNLSTDALPARFNQAIISVSNNVAGKQYYKLSIGQKISWQDWIENLNVPSAFFDATKPQNNLNYKSSNYAGVQNYSIRLGIKANVYGTNVLGQSGLTDYLFITPIIDVFDYENPTEWAGVIETFHPTTLVNLQGAVLEGEDTLMKVTWTNSGGPVVSLADTYVEHGIQDTGENGYNTDISTTLFAVAATNKLKTMDALAIVTGSVVSTCLIDGTLINSPQDLTAKLLKTLPIVAQDTKITEYGTAKEMEDGTVKKVE